MNKFITKVAKLVLGLSLAAGVGVAIGTTSKKASPVAAAETAGNYSLTITGTDIANFSNSYSSRNWSANTTGGTSISGVANQCYKSTQSGFQNWIQMNRSSTRVAGYYNTTQLPGKITSISIHAGVSSGSRTVKAYVMSSAASYSSGNSLTMGANSGQFGSSATVNSTSGADYSFSGTTDYKYFAIQVETNSAIYFESITVNYTVTATKSDVVLSLGSASSSMTVGGTQTLVPTATSGGSPVNGLTYSFVSSNPAVATVSSGGEIEALALGKTIITVTSAETNAYNAGSVTLNLSVSDPYVPVNLDFPDCNDSTVSTYTSTWEATYNSYTFSIYGANNSFDDHIRIGRKDNASSPTITSPQISERITSVCIVFSAVNTSKLTSAELLISANSNLSNATTIDFTSDVAATTVVISIPNSTSAADLYYKIAFEIASSSNNGEFHINQIYFRADPVSTVPTAALVEDEVSLYTNNSNGITAQVEVENCLDAMFEWTTSSNKITLENDDTDTVTIKPAENATAGDATVTVTVLGTDLDEELELTVHVIEPGPGETIGTPYTVAQARAAIDAGTGVTGVYATGIVSQIVSEYSSQYHDVSINISADGLTTSDQLEAFHCGGSDAEFVSVGDTVIIYGNLTKYNSTYEFGSGCEIVSRTSPWGFDRLELVTSAEYSNVYYKDSSFTPDGLTVNYVEVNSNTSAERETDVTAEATWNVDLTSTGSKTLSATFGGHTSNSISIIVVEKPSYDIAFGSAEGSVKIDSTSVTGNGWTITTTFSGDTSFTQNASYSQVGASAKPASTITFTKTINSVVTIKSFFIDLGGFSNTAGDVTLQVGSTTVGTGALNGTNDVTVNATNHGRGTGSTTVLTITIENIAKGVKVYGIAYTAKTDAEMVSEFITDYMHMSHTTNDGSCTSEGWYAAAKVEYGKLHDDQKSLFNNDSTYADAKARLIAWAAANGETFNPATYTFASNSPAKALLANVVGENTNTVAIIVIISLVSVTAIGGYFFLKKRREQN